MSRPDYWLGFAMGALGPFVVIFAVDKVQRCRRPRDWWLMSHPTPDGRHEHRYSMARWTSRRFARWHFDRIAARRCRLTAPP